VVTKLPIESFTSSLKSTNLLSTLLSESTINFLYDGFPKNFNNKITINEKIFFIDFINENTVQIKFKDNMQIDSVIKFYKND